MFSKEDIAVLINTKFDQMAHTNYGGFKEWLEAFCKRGEMEMELELIYLVTLISIWFLSLAQQEQEN